MNPAQINKAVKKMAAVTEYTIYQRIAFGLIQDGWTDDSFYQEFIVTKEDCRGKHFDDVSDLVVGNVYNVMRDIKNGSLTPNFKVAM